MLWIFLVIHVFLGPGAGEERVHVLCGLVYLLLSMSVHALIFVCASSCTSINP